MRRRAKQKASSGCWIVPMAALGLAGWIWLIRLIWGAMMQ